jgi:nucleoside triphosphate diphosphatase
MSNDMMDPRESPLSGPEELDRLLHVMARMRDPAEGCPWDVEQSFASIAPYTIEEAFEVADAIERGDWDDLEGELGDLLLQVVYHARIAEELQLFDFASVAYRITSKMIRRHPHVFATATVDSAAAQSQAWEDAKALERRSKAAQAASYPSTLDDLPLALPALQRAQKLQKRVARVNFDWPDQAGVLAKVREEFEEVAQTLEEDGTDAAREEEIGDLLFSIVNLARNSGIDAETALRRANAKFERRFRDVEAEVDLAGREDLPPLDELEAAWALVKQRERARAHQPSMDRGR